MKVVPLISAGLSAFALLCGIAALASDWSATSPNSLVHASASPFRACHRTERIVPLASRLASRLVHPSSSSAIPSYSSSFTPTSADCSFLDRETGTNLFALLGDRDARKHAGLAIASRWCFGIALAASCLSFAATMLMGLRGAYGKAWAVLPLVSSIVSLVLGILSLSFFANVHRHGLGAARTDLFPAKLSAGFTNALLFTIFSSLPLVSSIVDLSIPYRDDFEAVRSSSRVPSAAKLKSKAASASAASTSAVSSAAEKAKEAVGVGRGQAPGEPSSASFAFPSAAQVKDTLRGLVPSSATTGGAAGTGNVPGSLTKQQRRALRRQQGPDTSREELTARRRSHAALQREREHLYGQAPKAASTSVVAQPYPQPQIAQRTQKQPQQPAAPAMGEGGWPGSAEASVPVYQKPLLASSGPPTSEPRPLVAEGFPPIPAQSHGEPTSIVNSELPLESPFV